jgi:hypothetical protein
MSAVFLWFRLPPGGVSHVAWQVGHIAFSEYRLALWRIRGERPDDDALFSAEFKSLFGVDSVPQANSAYPPGELLWCAHHEMLHGGQIGLLRRHLGYPPR